MPWPPRFLFTSGRLSIDFVITGGEGERARFERWHTPSDFADWARACPDLEVSAEVSRRELSEAWELREAIWAGAQAVIHGGALPGEIEDVLNRNAARPPLVPAIVEGEATWAGTPTGRQVLSTVSRDAIDLFGTEMRSRLRECANPRCGLLFVDLSRPGNRRWCTMRRCGNLNKLARHRTGRGLADENE